MSAVEESKETREQANNKREEERRVGCDSFSYAGKVYFGIFWYIYCRIWVKYTWVNNTHRLIQADTGRYRPILPDMSDIHIFRAYLHVYLSRWLLLLSETIVPKIYLQQI